MAEHNDLGVIGEGIAAEFLIEKGYNILERNYRFDRAEVDIICKNGDELVVVEVKTRNSPYLAGPEETVTIPKQKSIIKAADAYVQMNEIDDEVRFDIVSVILNNKGCKIDHLEDAFYPLI